MIEEIRTASQNDQIRQLLLKNRVQKWAFGNYFCKVTLDAAQQIWFTLQENADYVEEKPFDLSMLNNPQTYATQIKQIYSAIVWAINTLLWAKTFESALISTLINSEKKLVDAEQKALIMKKVLLENSIISQLKKYKVNYSIPALKWWEANKKLTLQYEENTLYATTTGRVYVFPIKKNKC